MIQGLINNQSYTSFSYAIRWYSDISDKLVNTPVFGEFIYDGKTYYTLNFPYLLYKLESQQTGKTKIFTNQGTLPSIAGNRFDINTFERYMYLGFNYSVNPNSVEDLSSSELLVGNDEFPLGFYKLTLYETETDGELNPDNAVAVLLNEVLHMKARSADFQAVKYTEYTTNDSDTDSVYITN